MSLIRCRDLSIGYNSQQVIENLTFDLNHGDFLCVLGNNGSGKTSLMRTILGLNHPLGGLIEYGEGLSCKKIGYLPQQTAAQRDFPASVYEVVLSGCLNECGIRPFYSAAQKMRAAQAMELLGIESIRNRCYRELSGGQQQRTLLARALCASSKLIILDEPVTGLDPDATKVMYGAIRQLNLHGTAVIMVSHDLDAALKYGTHVLHLAHRPKFFGKVEDYLKSDAILTLRKEGKRYAP